MYAECHASDLPHSFPSFPCPTRHDPICRLQGAVVKAWAWCAEWRWCTDGDVLPATATTLQRNREKGKREEELEEGRLQKRNIYKKKTFAACYGNFSPSWKHFLHVFSRVACYSSLHLSPPHALHPPQPTLPPPSSPLNTPLQTGLSLWGALSFPLGWPGSFQGTLMDANAGLFQIVLQPEPLICQQASLHGLPVLRKCKSPPYRHL